MARPLSTSDPHRGGTNGNAYQPRYSLDDGIIGPGNEAVHELETYRAENAQLRALCAELEQALNEATQAAEGHSLDDRMRDYELLLEEKNETIRQLHQQLTNAQAAFEDVERNAQNAAPPRRPQGPLPREEELLALSEELERERRQLQEDEQTLMDQMRQMEVSMARERAEMARQRNDLQRLYGEIRHELERLERNGALQSKIEGLKNKLQDVSNRRGASPAPSIAAPPPSANVPPPQQPAPPVPPSRGNNTTGTNGGSFMGRFFGGNGSNSGGR